MAADAACVLVDPTIGVNGPGFGDAGHCLQLCNCSAECRSTELRCVPLDEVVSGKRGVCHPLGGFTELTTCS
jgi:hypothetical protein